AVVGERGEDEASIRVHARDPGQPQVSPTGRRGMVPFGEGADGERAVGAVRPAVIGADELARRSRWRIAHGRAAVSAAVDEGAGRAVGVARHDHGLAGHPRGEEVARIRDLALVPEQQPRPAEQPLHLELEHLRIGVDRAVDAIGLDQSGDVVGAERRHVADPAVLFPTGLDTARRDGVRRAVARRDWVAFTTFGFGLVYDERPMSTRNWDAALQRMVGRIDATRGQITDGFPHYGDPATGRWTTSPAGDWTGGFWYGLCWLPAHATGKDQYREWALAWARPLAPTRPA